MNSETLLKRTVRLPQTLCLLLCLCWAALALAEPVFKVGFVPPTEADDPFFSEVAEVMQAAAADLNIELKIDYAVRNVSMYSKSRGLKLIQTYKPDYMLTGAWPGGAKYHLQGAHAAGIKSFVFNTPPVGDGTTPRKELPGWLGQMTPDNRQAGYLLADILIEEARKRKLVGDDGKVRLIALSGGIDDTTGHERIAGLKARINQYKDAVLQETVLAGWMKDTADQETARLLNSYPATSVIWAASDHMAQGAAEAAERVGRKPGKDILVGGFDWNEANLRDIKTGRIAASVGGHALEGAMVLILLYDYHKGIDFAPELGLQFNSLMYAVTAENIDRYNRPVEGLDWDGIDFTRFSKALNPELQRYDFSLLFDAIAHTPAMPEKK